MFGLVILAGVIATLAFASPAEAKSGTPFGSLGVAEPVNAGIRVKGWAIDPDTRSPIRVRVRVDGRVAGTLLADRNRPGLDTARPGYGTRHGYDVTVQAVGGTHQVCVEAIGVRAGTKVTTLGCRTVEVSHLPFGRIEKIETVRESSGEEVVLVTGWAIDPDTPEAIRAYPSLRDVSVISEFGAPIPWKTFRSLPPFANLPRPDIGARYPEYGPDHGFVLRLVPPPVGFVGGPFVSGPSPAVCATLQGGTPTTICKSYPNPTPAP